MEHLSDLQIANLMHVFQLEPMTREEVIPLLEKKYSEMTWEETWEKTPTGRQKTKKAMDIHFILYPN
ncbi:MAG TPA: hypothetical protein VGB63_15770 [Pedobacter sp.]|jgi:hypothetical protein